jgi:hypothetical protein
MKCSECEYGEYLDFFNAYTCKNKECKDVPIFKGKTKPHCCPLTGGKKYHSHGNRKDYIEVRLPLRG